MPFLMFIKLLGDMTSSLKLTFEKKIVTPAYVESYCSFGSFFYISKMPAQNVIHYILDRMEWKGEKRQK